MVKIVHFDMPSGPVAEGVFSQIGKEIESTASRSTMDGAPHEEIVKESLKSLAERIPEMRDAPAPASAAPQASKAASEKDDGDALPAYLNDAEGAEGEEAKKAVGTLVHMVFTEGLDHAVRASKKYPPFLEDAFHDALVDRLVPGLKKRGVLK